MLLTVDLRVRDGNLEAVVDCEKEVVNDEEVETDLAQPVAPGFAAGKQHRAIPLRNIPGNHAVGLIACVPTRPRRPDAG